MKSEDDEFTFAIPIEEKIELRLNNEFKEQTEALNKEGLSLRSDCERIMLDVKKFDLKRLAKVKSLKTTQKLLIVSTRF